MKDLLSNLSLDNAEIWTAIAHSVLRIALVIVIAGILLRVGRKAITLFHSRMQRQTNDPEALKQVETLSRAARYLLTVVIFVVAGMLVLAAVGISIAPILAAAGVVGIAVGFGAQSLVKDYFTGFVLLLENQVRQGDVIEAGGKSGLVEEVTLRYIRMRDFNGNVHFVPNGIIAAVTNMTRGFSYAVMDVGVAYREHLDKVFQLIRDTASRLREDPVFGPKILEDIDIAGVENWSDSAIVIRGRIKTVPIEQWNVKREFLRRLKQTFDENGIEIPFPQRMVHVQHGGPALAFPDSSASTAAEDSKLTERARQNERL
jgi:small-conductance mechanosensitive channel